ncbi:hypothetical protein ACOCEA_16690 [Maribacter sp. CXY002]|uniref:hypothetical protein n=1 Tax=Maribacter luteocoastalis TaxID=3407671 RepID=UPI003B679A6A
MNNTSLEKFYRELIPILWEEIVFYIPDNQFANEFIENYKKFDFQKFKNKVLVIDYVKGPILYKSDRDNSGVILKGASLKKNIYQLINRKANSNELEFNYVLEQYYEQVECLFYITKWLQDNLTQLRPLESTIKGLFLIQYNSYKVHLETIIKHFYPRKEDAPENNLNLAKTIESSLPKLSKYYDKKEIRIAKQEILSGKGELTIKPPPLSKKVPAIKRVDKSPIITEKEAETILLKRIFNIDIKK